MRSSKSNPSKYVRKYRSVSQRKMTEYNEENDDEDAEMDRLRNLLRESEIQLSIQPQPSSSQFSSYDNPTSDKSTDEPTKRKRKSGGDDEDIKNVIDEVDDENDIRNILAPELLESDGYNNSTDDIITSKKKKQKSENQVQVQLTPEELKQAKALYKATQKKLQQLENRKQQKEKRTVLYNKLQSTALSTSELQLLDQSSSLVTISKHNSNQQHTKIANKKLYLQKLLRKERAGLQLNEYEQDLLYRTTGSKVLDTNDDGYNRTNNKNDDNQSNGDSGSVNPEHQYTENDNNTTDIERKEMATSKNTKENKTSSKIKKKKNESSTDDAILPNPDGSTSSKKKRKTDSQGKIATDEQQMDVLNDDENDTDDETYSKKNEPQNKKDNETLSDKQDEDSDDDNNNHGSNKSIENSNKETTSLPPKTTTSSAPSATGSSLAKQMMASFFQLKSQTVAEQASKAAAELQSSMIDDDEDDKNTTKPKSKRYVPSEPVRLQTVSSVSNELRLINGSERQTRTASVDHDSDKNPLDVVTTKTKVRVLNRPDDVQKLRYDLPINEMEYEIVDAIRNNDVTIICAETGSGKSTQVPQFLYEAKFSQAIDGSPEGVDEDSLTPALIGITQPRRVAAISTAKRVCYEMGFGDGRNIRNYDTTGTLLKRDNAPSRTGNPVAYQTRYETAGLGSSTHIKFMTDGILLQEIQNDLLLRKYSVIILDEAHERNLNTDCLIGLLSITIPLRKQAALQQQQQQQSSSDTLLKPLKVIIMSATLRVEDFTSNKLLFSETTNTSINLVKVPGRAHPVTIHHNKVTELDDYEDAVFRKTCKIHRRLPAGGILIFLTGKQEIIRMVNRLRRAFDTKKDPLVTKSTTDSGITEKADATKTSQQDTLRDMDDDEEDGDIFQTEHDDFDDIDKDVEETPENNDGSDNDDPDDNIPKKAIVLPLFSLLSADEQAKVFAPVPEGYRLIIVATNIAETSITIPDIKYVVDSGRQKCRNYNSSTGVASFNIMWISKAAADQRAGRAGRTGPGHCYRLYSSSMYLRHMDPHPLPEVLTRPLEDVVLAMKAMKISSISKFPFPTPPDKRQIDTALNLLANIGCVDISNAEKNNDDGEITRLGAAVAKLPLGVRCGKMILVAAEAGVLDYAIVIVAALSEQSPFVRGGISIEENEEDNNTADNEDDIDAAVAKKEKKTNFKWQLKTGDLLATLHAVGAYTFAGNGTSGRIEKQTKKAFCEQNGLNPVIMDRIQKMRTHLCKLAKSRLSYADGIATKTGGFLQAMKPPNKLQEQLLCQSIVSGLVDNVAMLAPLGAISGEHPFSLRSAYLSSSIPAKEPLFLDRNSVLFAKDPRRLPKWICYETLMRKTLKDGNSVAIMKNITPIEPGWLGHVAKSSRLLSLHEPLASPVPIYDAEKDAILCSVVTKFGTHGWEIPSVRVEMYDILQSNVGKKSTAFLADDSFRWFARYLIEGKVFEEIQSFQEMFNDSPSMISRGNPVRKVAVLVSALASNGIDSAAALRKHWSEKNPKFLFDQLSSNWIKKDHQAEFKKQWIRFVKQQCALYKTNAKA